MITKPGLSDQSISPPAGQHVPRPLAAGAAWAGLMAAVGVVYLLAHSLWQRAIADVGNMPLASRDQWWSLVSLTAAGFVVGATLAAVRRRGQQRTAESEPC